MSSVVHSPDRSSAASSKLPTTVASKTMLMSIVRMKARIEKWGENDSEIPGNDK
jgi:hypothetical protein